MTQSEVLPRADEVEVETYPIVRHQRKMTTYLVIGRIKDSEDLPWIEFQTDNYEQAKKEMMASAAQDSSKAYKIETRTIKDQELEEFIKSQKEVKQLIESLNS